MSKHKHNDEHTDQNEQNNSKEQNPFAQEPDNIGDTAVEESKNEQTSAQEADSATNAELETLKNQYVRLAADFDNFRKRQAQERESLLKYGAENTLKLLLPVIDTYNRGKKACDEMEDAAQLRENYEIIFKQLFEAFEKAGLKKIETIGKEFDPNVHEAIMQTPTSEHPDNSVIEELQAGDMLHDRVLRPAMVNVAVSE